MLGTDLPTLISRIFTLIIAFTVHEFSHAKVADWFGDDTPRMNGRLTLNPLKHLDIFGSLMLIIAGFGWAKPVPVNPYALGRRSPSAYMWVSLAGPASNLLMAIVAAAPLRLNWISRFRQPRRRQFFAHSLRVFIRIHLHQSLIDAIQSDPAGTAGRR